jgi:thiamine-monophosphate kinase
MNMPASLGEREIIRILTRIYGRNHRLPLGYTDDVAAIPLSSRQWMVLKSDMLVASTDVPPTMKLWQVARKALVATVSDFAAKGVRPIALMVSLGLPASINRSGIQEIGAGLAKASSEYNCRIIGGDTGESKDLVVDTIGAGVAKPNQLIRRSGAKPGDLVAVTGAFGKSAAGLKILLSRKGAKSREERKLARTVLLPQAKLTEGLSLAKTGAVTSSIDSSDGLAWSLHEIARSSNVSIGLDKVPVDRDAERFARRLRVSAVELALYGGEEYELVVTIRAREFTRVKRLVPSLIRIGRVGRGRPDVGASIGGRLVEVEPRGWEHFTSHRAV